MKPLPKDTITREKADRPGSCGVCAEPIRKGETIELLVFWGRMEYGPMKGEPDPTKFAVHSGACADDLLRDRNRVRECTAAGLADVQAATCATRKADAEELPPEAALEPPFMNQEPTTPTDEFDEF